MWMCKSRSACVHINVILQQTNTYQEHQCAVNYKVCKRLPIESAAEPALLKALNIKHTLDLSRINDIVAVNIFCEFYL